MTDYKKELEYLIESILEGEAATDIDAGCNGFGPVAYAMVALGYTRDEANLRIWGTLDDIGSDEELG